MLYTQAEYDRTNNRVVALMTPAGDVHTTHYPRTLGAPTEWLPLVMRYPDGYDDRFRGLLFADTGGKERQEPVEYRYDADASTIYMEFPEADFSPDAIRAELRHMVKANAKRELNATDWYFIRQLETGQAVPPEVVERREWIRAKADEYEQALGQADTSELSAFRITFGESPGDVPVPPEPEVRGADGREWITDATAPGQQGAPVTPVEEEE